MPAHRAPPSEAILCKVGLELSQEAQVVFQIEAQVVHVGLDQMDALDAKPEGKAGVALGIYAVRAQDVRMDQARAAQFQPAAFPGDSVIHARLDEREEVGPEAHQRL